MRLDMFLVVSRLVKRRSIARKLIVNGGVRVDRASAKPGMKLVEGDELVLSIGLREMRVRVLETAENRVSKAAARVLYEIIEEWRAEPEEPEVKSKGPINFLAGR
jgi:ribosomal 50S subunit-recycling heat shock protein